MSIRDDISKRDAQARLRFSIIGALFAAPPAKGELLGALRVLAAKAWRDPANGLDVRFGVSTLERWFYTARRARDPVAALTDRLRAHVGCFPSLSAQAEGALVIQYREHPGWTIQLHLDNLRVALAGAGGSKAALPSYPTVRRFFKARGMVRQRAPRRASDGAVAARDRLEHLEVRSFEVDHVGALWHLDFHHGSRKVLTRQGQWVKPMLMCVMDDRSRLVCHLQWYLDESAHSLVHALSQALMKRGLPRALMTDNGAAMLAAETTSGLARLGILHQTTLPYSPYQNAKQEVFWARVESRLMAMLEGQAQLSLDLLNQATQAWVEQEYHRSVHSEFDTTPLVRYLQGPSVSRRAPGSEALREAFRIEVRRRLRRSDATVSLEGRRYEIPSRMRHLQECHLRYARWDLSRVDLVDSRSGGLLYAVHPLDKSANADGQRRRLDRLGPDLTPLPATTMAPLMRQLLAEHAATGLPPAFLPTPMPANPSPTPPTEDRS
ncbi:MAG TPA: DDE-type integrase/transposase/recombinase [Candidatus Limnocylindrales bacterium]|nr:DDE-type integrase/transposase/recombinase [Candidatus Limnocylindrales bacterium]